MSQLRTQSPTLGEPVTNTPPQSHPDGHRPKRDGLPSWNLATLTTTGAREAVMADHGRCVRTTRLLKDAHVRRKEVVSRLPGSNTLGRGPSVPLLQGDDQNWVETGRPTLGTCRPRSSQGGWKGQGRRHHERTQSSAALPRAAQVPFTTKVPAQKIKGTNINLHVPAPSAVLGNRTTAGTGQSRGTAESCSGAWARASSPLLTLLGSREGCLSPEQPIPAALHSCTF